MTDKEQIIIDEMNVIVQQCIFWQEGHCDCYQCENRYPHCLDYPNCYFKQLARETQEINNIHEYYKELRSNATELANKNIQLKEQLEGKEQELYLARNEVHSKTEYIQEQRDIIKQLQQECEELKERASIAEDNFACEIQARLYHQNEWLKFSEENDRYRKALEEIEGEIKKYQCDNCEEFHCDSCDMKDILDIISQENGEE